MAPAAAGDDLTRITDAVYDVLVAPDPLAWSSLAPAEQLTRAVAAARQCAPLAAAVDAYAVAARVRARVGGFGLLEPVLADDQVSDVLVNGDGSVWVERAGVLARTEITLDALTAHHLIERMVAPLGRRIDRASPVVDARLPDGSRVHAVVPPVAVDGPCLTIRRFGARAFELDRFCGPGVRAFLQWAVRARSNIVVSGGTGSGKTTLLNALAGAIPTDERVITIEDTAELRLEARHVVRLEARDANADGAGALGVRALVRNALRMRPDRIIVGEVRGDEVVDMVQAMNTGHEGSLSTVHANNPPDALRRLEAMVLLGSSGLPRETVHDQLAAALDLVVQVRRGRTGDRRIASVHEVVASAGQVTTRELAADGPLEALPSRPPRRSESGPPDPGWLGC